MALDVLVVRRARKVSPGRRLLALRAVSAVQDYILSVGRPPTGVLSAVADYQATVDWPTVPGRREADGVWGSTTRRATARDLGVGESRLPPTAWDVPLVPIPGQPGLFRRR